MPNKELFSYDSKKKYLYAALQVYKTEPPNSAKRLFIDRLTAASRSLAENSKNYKQFHNLIVLRYIAEPPPSKDEICEALSINPYKYNAASERAINKLMVLAYGVDGIKFSESNIGEVQTMPPEFINLIIQEAVKQGPETVIKNISAEIINAESERYNQCLQNTQLLLKNYRYFLRNTQTADFYKYENPKEKAMLDNNLFVESIKQSQQRTAFVLKHIDEMLKYYSLCCNNSEKEDEKRKYRILTAAYIDEPKRSIEEIIESEHIERRTYYRNLAAATEEFAALLFGIDGTQTK
ncbi:MAG: hypothetical protein LUD81_01380 [Clostridiales bacterium]|nr:hypothetical protein [Clostridiales bacterium]